MYENDCDVRIKEEASAAILYCHLLLCKYKTTSLLLAQPTVSKTIR